MNQFWPSLAGALAKRLSVSGDAMEIQLDEVQAFAPSAQADAELMASLSEISLALLGGGLGETIVG